MESAITQQQHAQRLTGKGIDLVLPVAFSLFFVFGSITSLNDVLMPRLKELFALNYAQMTQPAGSNPFRPDVTGRAIENIELDAGDFLIWNSLLAHGVRPNRSEHQVRMAQYISMFPADFDNEPLRQARIKTWAEQTHPVGVPFPGDPREFEKKNFEVARLNPLGRKLLGLDRWN